MNDQQKRIIQEGIADIIREDKVSKSELFAMLDAVVTVWNKAENKQSEKDLYEGVMFGVSPYKEVALKGQEVDLASYMSTFPKALLKGVDFDGDNADKMISQLIAKTVEIAVKNDYKESKNITISDRATYRAKMEKFEEEQAAGLGMIEKVKALKGEEGAEAVKQYLNSLAKLAISEQREYFFNNIDGVVKMHAKIEIARAEEEKNGIEVAV